MGARDETPVREFMTKNPVAMAADDDCAVAASSIREYRLKSLPIVERKDNRKLVGCLKVRRMMAFVFEKLQHDGEMTPGTAQKANEVLKEAEAADREPSPARSAFDRTGGVEQT